MYTFEPDKLRKPISDATLEKRWDMVREEMKKENVDALVIQNEHRYRNGMVRYFTDIGSLSNPVTVFFPIDDEMTVFANGGGHSLSQTPAYGCRGVKDRIGVPIFPTYVPELSTADARGVADLIKKRDDKKIGLVRIGSMLGSFYQYLTEALTGQVEFVDFTNAIDELKAIKNEEEIAIMKKASEINDMVMEKAANYIKEGMTEKQIADFIDSEYLKAGASGTSFDTIVCFGPNAADQHHTPSDTRTLKAGECVLIDMGCVWQGYCSDMTRTFYCKSADPEQTEIHDIVREAVLRAESVIKPGVKFCDIDAQARDYIDEKGYSEYWKIRLGHFIGQEDHEYGDVSPINKNEAEPGMIFSIEPGIYIEGKYGVRIEDLVLVTEDGHELLNSVEKKWRIVG